MKMMIFMVLFVVPSALGMMETVVEEFSEKTDNCRDAAITAHPENPNESLDHFLRCLNNKMKTVSILTSHVLHSLLA